MPKLSYLLISVNPGKYPSAIGVCGGSTKPYGYAEYDRALNCHTLLVSQEQWEGGMDRDVTNNKHRSFGKWIVRAIVEPDLETPEGQQAAEIDRLKARVAELEQAAPTVKDSLSVAPEGGLAPLDDIQEQAKAISERVRGDIAPASNTSGLSRHRALRAEAKAANEQGAAIDLGGSTDSLQQALNDWKAKAA